MYCAITCELQASFKAGSQAPDPWQAGSFDRTVVPTVGRARVHVAHLLF